MKFNLSDFLQLDTKGLLAVNGGFTCGGSSNSPSESSTSESTGNSNGGSTTTVFIPTGPCNGYLSTKHSKGNGFSDKTINDHIKDLQASKKNYETDASKLTKGVYVVFMADKEKTLESHAALLFVEDGGGAFMYDNSSHNFRYKDSDGKTAYYGGIERTNGNSAKAVCNQYVGYENFYFQQL